jgi:hypothetical protein
VIYAPGAAAGEIALGEQSRPDLLWPVDILLGAGGNAVLSGRWRAFALGHRLRVGDHLVFRFKLGALEASVRIFTTGGVRRTYPLPAAQSRGDPGAVVFWGGELASSPLLLCSPRRRGMSRHAFAPPLAGDALMESSY